MYPETHRPPSTLRLPLTPQRSRSGIAFCRVLTGIASKHQNTAFEGPLYRPGSAVPIDVFGPSPTVIECAGRAGPGRRQPMVWILWSYDWKAGEWREVARAQAYNAEWADVLKPAAIDCLNRKPELYEVRARSLSVAEELIAAIDQRLAGEHRDIQITVLATVYDRICSKIAESA